MRHSRAIAALLGGLLALHLPACSLITKTVYIESRRPIIKIRRPEIPAGGVVTPREQALIKYARELEGRIKRYNAAAKKHNSENGYESEASPSPEQPASEPSPAPTRGP
jgi:hypothetical protein